MQREREKKQEILKRDIDDYKLEEEVFLDIKWLENLLVDLISTSSIAVGQQKMNVNP